MPKGAENLPEEGYDDLSRSIDLCLKNADRILDESYDLEFREPPSTRFYIVLIAQEEISKAFILYLIREKAVPLTAEILRAINDHSCKQLVGVVLDYIIAHWETMEEFYDLLKADTDVGDRMPSGVGSAIEIFRYEKIGRWKRNNWAWAEDPKYDKQVLKIANGKKDRRKQDSLYVRIDKNGRTISTPAVINTDEMRDEFERAQRYSRFMQGLFDGEPNTSFRYDKAMGAFETLFRNFDSES